MELKNWIEDALDVSRVGYTGTGTLTYIGGISTAGIVGGRSMNQKIYDRAARKGCKYSTKECLDCRYLDGQVTIKFKAKCIEDYPHGPTGLAADMRRSMAKSLSKKGFAMVILASIFNQTKGTIGNTVYGKVK